MRTATIMTGSQPVPAATRGATSQEESITSTTMYKASPPAWKDTGSTERLCKLTRHYIGL